MVKRLLLILMFMVFSLQTMAKELTAQVDRHEIGINESVELVVTLSGANNGQRPDLTELYKDFNIDHHSQSSNVTVVNGLVNQQIRWLFLLSPNREGDLTIPALKVGARSTDPIEIKVGEASVAATDDLLMDVEVRPLHPYVQSQMIYIQRLYYSRPFMNNSSISNPKISRGEANIEILATSEPRYVKHNGRPYQLIERYFAVFPKQAGPLHFEPSVFRGSLATSRARQNHFSMQRFNNGPRVSAYSPKTEITIKDKPASFTGEHWLPASQVTLSMNWSRAPETLKAGEPVTVTIALMAEGVKAETLPEVTLALPDALKLYPEQPNFRSGKGSRYLTGLREEKFTLVGNEAGEYQVPAVEVPWWNTNTDQQEVAQLKPFTIKVAGGVSSQSQTSAPVEKTIEKKPSASDASNEAKDENNEVSTLADSVDSQSAATRFYDKNTLLLIVSLMAIFSLFVIWYVWRKRVLPVSVAESKEQYLQALSVLSIACRENNSQAAITALPAWASAVDIYPATLSGIERCGETELTMAIRELSQASYSPQARAWNGEGLLKAVTNYTTATSDSSETNGLTPLHPIA